MIALLKSNRWLVTSHPRVVAPSSLIAHFLLEYNLFQVNVRTPLELCEDRSLAHTTNIE